MASNSLFSNEDEMDLMNRQGKMDLSKLNRKLVGMIRDQLKHNRSIENRRRSLEEDKFGLQERAYEQGVEWTREDRQRRMEREDVAFEHQKNMWGMEELGSQQVLQAQQKNLSLLNDNIPGTLTESDFRQTRSALGSDWQNVDKPHYITGNSDRPSANSGRAYVLGPSALDKDKDRKRY